MHAYGEIARFLLNLPTPACVALAIGVSTAFAVALYFVVHPFWARGLTEETRKTADLVATRLGVVYSIVIGMMFANVRIEHIQMVEAIESEASALTRLYSEIERQGGDEGTEIRNNLVEYIRFIVEEQWPALREARVQPEKRIGGKSQLEPVWDYVVRTEQQTGDPNLRRLMDQVEHYKIMRLFDSRGNLLPLFWYIAGFGYLATLVTLYLSPPTLQRCLLVSLYSSMVAVVLIGIFILSHPYSPAAGVEPSVFKWLLQASPP